MDLKVNFKYVKISKYLKMFSSSLSFFSRNNCPVDNNTTVHVLKAKYDL